MFARLFARSLARPAPMRAFSSAAKQSIPTPRGAITDHTVFLSKIGRSCEGLGDKIQDWNHLFTVTSNEMKHQLGFTPKQRRWILNWTEKYRQGVDPYFISKPDKRLRKKMKQKPRK
ncbi:IGR protein motif-domain-containing protein [Thamnocephalis sphaerospora]|uniref:Small ribosomal subunit protein mS41 n=1 Tax=Thamnocephalis sphaerospora TaxID=78915 RepID=A0A4P9XRA2_9FUNG|nr:IGR protein motif-domain-containing protein [Thamnocephalis sphaerospora]|eukprot:RKP08588.1 IGR protein motif-domain-containing protein [Thamnocephalis sphaerospora]